jgi:hypothetical protein
MKILLFLAALTALFAGYTPAAAKSKCTPRQAAILNLDKLFGEQLAATGLTQDGRAIVELYTSHDATWTLMLTRTDGVSCIIASGNDWKEEASEEMALR